ncbi:MAG: Gfo/Idh/MocA family oxidoreductase [Ruminococcaceae bacterium]|nr:Gfo/Idh/MocA family oxidoreductase [Oscillospiraceae bacterium]
MINACVVGLGNRGYDLLKKVLLKISSLNIVAVCDLYEDRIQRAIELVREAGQDAKGFTDYKEALAVDIVDAVFVFSDWSTHTEIAVYAMKKGIAVASEVGCEYSLENCYELVRVQEETGTPYMFVENCCWGKAELLATAMARKGKFGTVVHCSGSYSHDLRDEIAYGHVNRHYRFDNYLNRCCDNYPTHDLGPIAKLLDINRGNRILTVSSFATKAVGLKDYIKERDDATEEMKNADFKQGDVIITILTCANGETIMLRLDTTLPRSYTRDFTVRGTKGMFMQDTNSVFLDGEKHTYWDMYDYYIDNLNNAKKYEEEYLPSIWKNITDEEMKAGHGGMDWFCYKAFTDALINKTEMPVDVYDAATWQAVSVLSEISIQQGGAPQAMPDFTNGKWYKRPRKDVCDL